MSKKRVYLLAAAASGAIIIGSNLTLSHILEQSVKKCEPQVIALQQDYARYSKDLHATVQDPVTHQPMDAAMSLGLRRATLLYEMEPSERLCTTGFSKAYAPKSCAKVLKLAKQLREYN